MKEQKRIKNSQRSSLILQEMQLRHFLGFLLLLLGVAQLIEARGGGGGRGGGRIGGFGGGGLFSGWSNSRKSSSSPSSSSSSSSSSARTSSSFSSSNGGAISKPQNYAPSISRRFNEYRPISNPRYSSYPFYNSRDEDDNIDYRHRFKSVDNDVNAGFAIGFSTTRNLRDLLELVNMRLPNDDPTNDDPQANSQESLITQFPNDIEAEISRNFTVWFELIRKPISDKIFKTMRERATNSSRMTMQSEETTTETQAVLMVDNEEFKETVPLSSNSNEDSENLSTKQPPIDNPSNRMTMQREETTTETQAVLMVDNEEFKETVPFSSNSNGDSENLSTQQPPIENLSANTNIVCVEPIDTDSSDLIKTAQNRNCFSAAVPESVERISLESREDIPMNDNDDNDRNDDHDRAFKLSEREAKPLQQQQQPTVVTVVNESLKPVLKIMKQKEPGNIFNVPDEIF